MEKNFFVREYTRWIPIVSATCVVFLSVPQILAYGVYALPIVALLVCGILLWVYHLLRNRYLRSSLL